MEFLHLTKRVQSGGKFYRSAGHRVMARLKCCRRQSMCFCLLAATISIFAISTYNTDYILVKRHDFDAAADILKQNGYQVA